MVSLSRLIKNGRHPFATGSSRRQRMFPNRFGALIKSSGKQQPRVQLREIGLFERLRQNGNSPKEPANQVRHCVSFQLAIGGNGERRSVAASEVPLLPICTEQYYIMVRLPRICRGKQKADNIRSASMLPSDNRLL